MNFKFVVIQTDVCCLTSNDYCPLLIQLPVSNILLIFYSHPKICPVKTNRTLLLALFAITLCFSNCKDNDDPCILEVAIQVNDHNATLVAVPKNGLEPYTYKWHDGSSLYRIDAILSPGVNKNVTVTDNAGCTATASVATCNKCDGLLCFDNKCYCPQGYVGELCDSLPGASGDPRFHLSFTNHEEVDLDLFVRTPLGNTISYSTDSADGGRLDLDCLCGGCPNGGNENIFWVPGTAPAGTYEYWVSYYGYCGAIPGAQSTYVLRVFENNNLIVKHTDSIESGNSVIRYYTP